MLLNIKNNTIKFLNLKIVRNGFWLYTLQIFNTVIPLITLPYITRILGPSQYGVFSSALNLVIYFQVVVEYGFDLSGTRKVAINKDIDKISELYTRITYSKLILCIITFLMMICFSIILNIPKEQFVSMLLLYTMVVGTAIQQTWLFQGFEDMKFITIASVISRSISVVLVFLLVKKPTQIFLYSSLYALTYLLMGIISLTIARVKYRVKFKRIKFVDVIDEIKDGWYLFTTSAMSKIFSGIGITVLTFTTTDTNVGIYTAIQKIPLVMKMIYAPIGQVIYPYISKHYIISFEKGSDKVKFIAKYIISFFVLIGFSIVINSKTIVRILYGPEYAFYSQLLIPLIVWMILSIANNLLGVQVLVASGHLKEYSISFRIGVISIIAFNILFGIFWDVMGVALAAMFAELVLTIAIIYQILKIKR